MSEQTELDELKETLCNLAQQIAENSLGRRLDYSVESIKDVEHILGEIHDDCKKTRSEEGLQGIAFAFGAYIVKMIEQQFGPAQWKRNHEIFGENSFPLEWRDSTLFPVEWCIKRIFDGPGDNVWTKFQAFILANE